eukprot:1753798-Rhodomonas_salina.3
MRKKFKETKSTKNEKTPDEQLLPVDTPGFLATNTSGSAFVATVETGTHITETQDNLDNIIQHEIKSFRPIPPAQVSFDIVGTLMCLAHITRGVSASIIATIVCLLGVCGHYLALPAAWSLVGFLLYVTSVVGPSILLWVLAVLLLDCYVQHPRFSLVYKLKRRKSVQLAQLRAKIMMWQAIQLCNFASAHMATAQVSPHIMMASASTMKTLMFVDTGCAISIVNSREHLVNVPSIHPIWVQGIAGTRDVTLAGDLHLPATSNDGVARIIVVNNVLLDEESPVSLLSADQLWECGFSVRIKPSDRDCCLVLNPHGDPISFPSR